MRRAAAILAILGLVAGLLVSWTLLSRSLDLLSDTESSSDVCSAMFGSGCDDALSDPASMVLGVPLAGWGVLYFGGVILLLLFGAFLGGAFRSSVRTVVGMLLVVGALASLWLLGLFVRGGMEVCPLCVVVNALNILSLLLYMVGRGRALRDDVRTLGSGAGYLLGRAPVHRVAARWRVIGFLCVLLAVVVAYQRLLLEVQEREGQRTEFSPGRILRDFLASPRRELGLGDEEAYIGSAEAPIDLVVFGDAYCPHCKEFWKQAQGLVDLHGQGLRIVFKHLPLDKTCNLGVALTVHPGACEAARALEAARRQGQFWAFYAALTDADSRARPGGLEAAAREAGLDWERFQADLDDPATLERVARDVRMGNDLGIQGIPTFILDGRNVPDPPLPSIQLLLDHLVRTRRPRTP